MKKSLLVMIAGIAVLAFAVGTWAQGPQRAGKGGAKSKEGKGMMYKHQERACWDLDATQLGLSDEQKQKTDALSADMKAKRQEIATKVNEVREELQKLWQADELDAAKIKEKVSELSDLRTKIMEQNVDSAVQLKQILTKEQWEKVKTDRPCGIAGFGMWDVEGQLGCPLMGTGMGMGKGPMMQRAHSMTKEKAAEKTE
jgi:Spy/CpxP family protein refolding chaperone